jgi:hypothetical protein
MSSYQPSSEGDENNEVLEDDATIPLGSPANKSLKIPCLLGAPSPNVKVNTLP